MKNIVIIFEFVVNFNCMLLREMRLEVKIKADLILLLGMTK